MKEGDACSVRTLRMFKAEIMKEEVAGTTKRELTDDDILKVARRLIKQRKDSAEQFITGNRPELAQGELEEITILERYLPAQMSAEELRHIIANTKAALGITDASQTGKLIGAVVKAVDGRADGGAVKSAVEASF